MKSFIHQLGFLGCASVLFACKKQEAASPSALAAQDTVPVRMEIKAVTTPVGNAVNGYYVALPSNYEGSNKVFPLLLYLPGVGQLGNGSTDLPLLLNDGPVKLIKEGRFPTNIKTKEGYFNFIVFMPQPRWYPSIASIKACVDFAKANYRVDAKRLYVSGLSMGGILACDLAAETPAEIAAVVPMAGVSRDYDVQAKCRSMADARVPLWIFHTADDSQFPFSVVQSFTGHFNNIGAAVKPRLTVWPNGGHDAWTRALEPAYKENGLNIYEWMLQYHR